MKVIIFIGICVFLNSSYVFSHILFLGDTSLGENYQKKLALKKKQNYLKSKGPQYFFKNFKAILNSSYANILNFESVITDKKNSPHQGVKSYLHKDSPKLIFSILKSYNLKYLSLANNHSIDYGVDELVNSFTMLSKNNIKYFGAGSNEQDALKPITIKTKSNTIKIFAAFEQRLRYQIKYQAYAIKNSPGVISVNSKKFTSIIRKSKKDNKNTLHIAFIHWGKNYSDASKRQYNRAKKLIAAGIDLIIGHGAHHFQKAEKINKKWVFYNIGNFIFPSPGRYAKKKAHPYSLILSLNKTTLKIYPIFSNNKLSNYQPYFINKKQHKKMFIEIPKLLFKNNEKYKTGNDKYSSFIEVQL